MKKLLLLIPMILLAVGCTKTPYGRPLTAPDGRPYPVTPGDAEVKMKTICSTGWNNVCINIRVSQQPNEQGCFTDGKSKLCGSYSQLGN